MFELQYEMIFRGESMMSIHGCVGTAGHYLVSGDGAMGVAIPSGRPERMAKVAIFHTARWSGLLAAELFKRAEMEHVWVRDLMQQFDTDV
jgi:hypothetical protein